MAPARAARPTSPTCSPQAAAESPDRLAIVEAGGRGSTWAELDDEVGRLATGLGAAGHRRRPPGDDRARQPDRVRDDLPRGAARPGRRRTRQPDVAAGELARMIADSGSRMVVADADTVTAVRAAVAAARGGAGRRAPGRLDRGRPVARLVIPRSWSSAATLQPGERSYDHLRADARARRTAAAGPGEAGRPPLHQRYVGPPARRDAHPPRPARQHRAGRRRRAADDPRRRRRARRAAAVPRLRPQRGARRGAAPPRQAGARPRGSTRRAPST